MKNLPSKGNLMQYKDLQHVISMVYRNFGDLPAGLSLEGMKNPLNERELVAMAYFKAITDHLVSIGILKDSPDLHFQLFQKDSNPVEEDYLLV